MRVKEFKPELLARYFALGEKRAYFTDDHVGMFSISEHSDGVSISWLEDLKTLPETLKLFTSTPVKIALARDGDLTVVDGPRSLESALDTPEGVEMISIDRALGGLVVWEYQPYFYSTLTATNTDWDTLRYMAVELDAGQMTKALPKMVSLLN